MDAVYKLLFFFRYIFFCCIGRTSPAATAFKIQLVVGSFPAAVWNRIVLSEPFQQLEIAAIYW